MSELRTYEGILELAPVRGSKHPELSWGDHFFYYAPDGLVPRNRQPYATMVTKDYPDDAKSCLDEAGRWRLNIHVGSQLFADLIGSSPGDVDSSEWDYSTADVINPHPLYGAYGWVCVVNPGPSTIDRALDALRHAHVVDRRRVERRTTP